MTMNLKTVLFLFGVFLVISGPSALAHTDVTAKQARELIDSTGDLTIIDVREPSEYSGAGGHIPGALNYPLNSGVMQNRYEELPTNSPILVVCGSGSRSHRAAKFLDSMGFSTVYDMQAGISAWTWETETSAASDGKYGGGTGEPNDPYQIATAEDLILLGETPEDYDKHFILTADIDLDPNLPGRKVFDKAVIAPDTDPNDAWSDFQGTSFTGLFDGNGYIVSHLTIKGSAFLGLFGLIESECEVRNLGLVDVKIIGSGDCIGGLAAYSMGNLTRCYSIGTAGGNDYVGGLIGHTYFGSVTQCYSSGAVDGHNEVGGLLGATSISVINNCYSSASVSGCIRVGGLVGLDYEVGELISVRGYNLSRCYSVGLVVGENEVGGLLGHFEGREDELPAFDGLWDIETSVQSTSAAGTGKTTAEMQIARTFLEAGWDFVDEAANGTEEIWSICEGTNYPRFVWQIPVGDFVCPDGITIEDFAFFMEHWLDDNCDSSNDYCEGTDLDRSGKVDVNDLEIFFESWSAQQ